MTIEQLDILEKTYDESFEFSTEMSEIEENIFYDNLDRLNNIQGWY